MKIRRALLPLLAVPFALSSCATNTAGTPSNVGMRNTQLAADAKEFKDNDGYIIGIPVLIVASAGAEVGATAVGAVESTGKALQKSGKAGSNALDWWIHEAPKD